MKRRSYLALLLVFICHLTQADTLAEKAGVELDKPPTTSEKVQRFFKRGVQKGLRYIPGGEELDSFLGLGDDLEAKVDRIEQRQETSLDRIRDIAQKALKTKDKVEEMYYFKKRSERRATEIAEGLSRSKKRKFLGVMVEDALGISINPADYVPYTESTRKLKENLALDLSLERGLLGSGGYMLRDTRGALIECGLYRKSPEQFEKEYQKAVAYEVALKRALAAKESANIKLYKEEIDRLSKEIRLLEKAKGQKGLTVSDVMQLELTIETKRKVIRELNEKITAGLKEALRLTEKQQAQLAAYRAQQGAEELATFLEKDRKRMHAQYGHLWSF